MASTKWSGLPAEMVDQEYARLREVLEENRPEATLEIGMAHGGSTVVLCEFLKKQGHGKHTAIDPYQTAPEGWAGKGVERVRQAGLDSWYELLEDFDYLALPRLVAARRTFDFILIDGWHSFDYTLLDIFFADKLLKEKGVLAVHDTGWPAVFKACRFLETHKPYDRLGPPIDVEIPGLIGRLARRALQILRGPKSYREARSRRQQWFSLGVYRKRANHQVADNFFVPF